MKLSRNTVLNKLSRLNDEALAAVEDIQTLIGTDQPVLNVPKQIVQAVHSARMWAIELNKMRSAPELDRFIQATAMVKELRDFLEHEPDYERGIGWKQEKYLHNLLDEQGKTRVIGIRPQTLVIADSGVLLGGRVPLKSISQSLHQLRAYLGKLVLN